jgi:hypothetical protein
MTGPDKINDKLCRCYKLVWLFGLFVCILFSSTLSVAQSHPPRPISISVNPTEYMKFGAFFQGTVGGSVILYADGSRSTTGDIIGASLGYSFSPAIFDVQADLGTRVVIMNGPDVVLTGSNGGSLTLHIGNSNVGSPFVSKVAPPGKTQVMIGGTLTVGTALANPVGSYTGMFTVTFIQE